MRVLILYGSTLGGTRSIAQWLAAWLAERGVRVDVLPADQAPATLTTFDGIIVGGALYRGRWHPSARRFVERRADELRRKQVWLFSSGPLDDSACTAEVPPVEEVSALMERIKAREHRTFGGRLATRPEGLFARLMARRHSGDWRSPKDVRQFAEHVAEALREQGFQGRSLPRTPVERRIMDEHDGTHSGPPAHQGR